MSDEIDQQQLEGGTYEVIRRRLEEQGKTLLDSANKLNAQRQECFGGSETTLLNTTRARTEHNCVPRDVIRLSNNRLLLGYTVHMGLKNETSISDVFAELEFDNDEFKSVDLSDLADDGFERDFKEIFEYYKTARLLQLRRTETHILMVFQTGNKLSDIKVLRWAIQGDKLVYQDNRGERDHKFPNPQDFKWIRTTRDDHSYGSHPHVNIADLIFVECIGGDLTIKIEDNTESGSGVYAEDVEEKSQGLDDAEILYADLESAIVLKIRPYRENEYRYIVYNKQTQEAARIDSIGSSCQQLPEGHGLIFPNGFYLSNGVYKIFPHNIDDMEFIRAVRSPNGEDSAYIYHHRLHGSYIILQYNLIDREVAVPQQCNGYTIAEDGRLIIFRADNEPSRVHTMQIWQTPFFSEEYAAQHPVGGDSFLGTIGNKDLVRGISDILHINRLITNQSPNMQGYEDLLRRIGHVIDINHWLGHEEAFGLEGQLRNIQKTADGVIDEFEKVQQLKEQAERQIDTLQSECKNLLRDISLDGQHTIDDYVKALSSLRAKRGQINTARDLRYVDTASLDELEKSIIDNTDRLSQGAVEFLLKEDSLNTYTVELSELESQGDSIKSVTEAQPIVERVDELSAGLDMLMEIVNSLDIADSTDRTAILERISEVYGTVNRVRALVEANRKELSQREGRAEFGVQFKILAQTASNYLGLCDDAEKTDNFLAKLMIQVEEMEAQYIDFDDFLDDLSTKREEIYESFNQRKQSLLDERQRKADGFARSAERILSSVKKRAVSFDSMDKLNAYFASDNMVQKARSIVDSLIELGDTVRADDLAGQIKSAREDAIRHIRDKTELFSDGNLISFGRHKFSVNTQALDLTMLTRDEEMFFHLTGTDYFHRVEDESFQATERFWTQDVSSENRDVYRAEYLAWQIIDAAEKGLADLNLSRLHEIVLDENDLKECIRNFASQRYEEAYERGLHDADAAKILFAVIQLRQSNGLLRFAPNARALMVLFWNSLNEDRQQQIHARCRSLFVARESLGAQAAFTTVQNELTDEVLHYAKSIHWSAGEALVQQSLQYLCEEIGRQDSITWSCSGSSADLITHFHEHLDLVKQRDIFERELLRVRSDIPAALDMVKVWLSAYALQHQADHIH
ncbi:MAG: DNA repair ATPase, partial [Planctomycetes bacterium]|nr:DNA repair ATPase [Planctomycetota bacterium]